MLTIKVINTIYTDIEKANIKIFVSEKVLNQTE